MLASTAGVFTHFALNGGGLHNFEQGGTPIIGYGVLLSTIATVLPTFMMSIGMKKIGSNNVAIISAVGPVSTIIQAHFILGEKIFTAQIIGTLFVIIGVILIGWKRN